MRFLSVVASMMLLVTAQARAAPPEPDVQQLIASNSLPLDFTGGHLAGPGAALLEEATADSQFVLLGEDHYQHDVPILGDALFRMLRAKHGFHHLVVEQDRIAIEDSLKPGNRGNAAKLGALAHRYPGLFEFASDQDLELLADVGRLSSGPTAICGIEQALGPERYFDELRELAPNAAVRSEIERLRARAVQLDAPRKYSVNFLIDGSTERELADLRSRFGAKPGSRADEMLFALARSAEIFGYYRRSEAGEPVGLYNNTVRETWLKRLFMRCYQRAASSETLPKMMFKFGANHMYHGMNATQAFPIGNLAHEFAIANGHEGYGIYVQGLKDGAGYDKLPDWLKAVFPAHVPDKPLLVNLRSLRPYQRFLRAKLQPDDIEPFRKLINGYDAIILLPHLRPADIELSGLDLDYN